MNLLDRRDLRGKAKGLAPTDLLVRSLEAMDASPITPRGLRQGYIPLADLARRCPREIALSIKYGLVPISAGNSNQRIVWELRRAAERHVRGQLAQVFHDLMEGSWVCLTCSREEDTRLECCGRPMEYSEVELASEGLRITGHSDILMRSERRGKVVPVEIKSIMKEGFKKLERPLGDHVRQLAGYWGLLGDRAEDYAVIIYVSKDAVAASPYLEYRVTRQSLSTHWEQLQENAEAIWAMVEEDIPIGRLSVCPSSGTPTAKKCHACTLCFATP